MTTKSFLYLMLDTTAVFFVGYALMWWSLSAELSLSSWLILICFTAISSWRLFLLRRLLHQYMPYEQYRKHLRTQKLCSIPIYFVLLLLFAAFILVVYILFFADQVQESFLQELTYRLLERDSLLRQLVDIYSFTPQPPLVAFVFAAGLSHLIAALWPIRSYLYSKGS